MSIGWKEINQMLIQESWNDCLKNLWHSLPGFLIAGKATELEDIRYRIVKDYKLFYRITDSTIEVLTVWDSRRNPQNLRL